jgi:hypothetical protein
MNLAKDRYFYLTLGICKRHLFNHSLKTRGDKVGYFSTFLSLILVLCSFITAKSVIQKTGGGVIVGKISMLFLPHI